MLNATPRRTKIDIDTGTDTDTGTEQSFPQQTLGRNEDGNDRTNSGNADNNSSEDGGDDDNDGGEESVRHRHERATA